MNQDIAAQSITSETVTLDGIPLIGYDQLDLKEASAAPLISILADILISQCTRPALAPANAQPAAA
jgi:hypothetical protein